MKIGFDAKRLFANYTGLGNYSRSLLRNLINQYPENQYHLFAPQSQKSQETSFFFEQNAIHIHESKALVKSYWRSFSIVKDLQKTGIALYHGLSNELPHKISDSGIKSVVTIHDLIFKVYPATYSLSERIIYHRKFLYACRQADKIVAISENTKQDIIKLYAIAPEKIEVIYQSCNPIFYALRSDSDNEAVHKKYQLPQQYLLYVGSVEARKNLKLIIEAYKLDPSIHIPLLIIGKGGKYKAECKQLIQQYGLTKSFVWLDRLEDNTDLQSIYQRAKALIYPSFYEGFGLPVAEALLSKTPVIAANTSSLKEAGGPNSIYIDPQNTEELASAVQTLLKDEELVATMRQKGYEYAHKTFSIEGLTSQMHRLYQSILQ